MKKLLSYTLLFAFTALALSSCKKDEETEEMVTPLPGVVIPTSTIQVNPVHLWEDAPFELGTTYNIDGVDVQFDEVRFYLSKFMMTDMMDISEPGETAILVSAASTDPISIGGTSLNHVHSLGFLFGLDSITNHQDPTLALAPLNDPLMHWGWNPDAGYKFLKVEGRADIAGDGNLVPFSIHAATDELRRDMSAMLMLDLEEGSYSINMNIDYHSMFLNVAFDNLTGTHGASELTNGIADNIQSTTIVFE